MYWSSMKSTSYKTLALYACLAGGVHAAASSALPMLLSWGSWLSLLALFFLAMLLGSTKTFKQAFLTGWAFAFVWLLGSVWWLYVSMHQYGGMPALLAASAVVLFCLALALIYGLAMGLARTASPAGTLCTVSFAVLWMLAEMLRGSLLTGFPWAASGYAHVDGILAAYVPWLGVYGVSGVAALVAAAVALIVQYVREYGKTGCVLKPIHGAIGVTMVVMMFAATWLLPRDFTQSTGSMKVALLQGNVEQSIKFDSNMAMVSTEWYLQKIQESAHQGAQLVVLPETAIPFLWELMQIEMQQEFSSFLGSGDFAVLIGMPALGSKQAVTNSIFGFVSGERVYRYDKYHLVPFGEFIPPGFRWFVSMMQIPLGDMGRGDIHAKSFVWGGQNIAPNICYEDLFGEELARRFNEPAQDAQPTMMVNGSNIAWFGDTVAIPQHLQIARMRTIEFQRPMIRATNTGATAIINHRGEVTALLPSYTQGVLMGEVQGRSGLTPYAWWSGRFGLTPLVILSMMVLAFARFMQKKLSTG
ncbi:MAG: apolipoprotein N-acyltransferase [Saezia sp.]